MALGEVDGDVPSMPRVDAGSMGGYNESFRFEEKVRANKLVGRDVPMLELSAMMGA